jgi:hypothetical protein
LVLARFYTRQDTRRADSLARQFAHLAAAETDVDQLTRYRTEVAEMAPKIVKQCSPDTAAKLRDVATDRFLVALKPRKKLP